MAEVEAVPVAEEAKKVEGEVVVDKVEKQVAVEKVAEEESAVEEEKKEEPASDAAPAEEAVEAKSETKEVQIIFDDHHKEMYL